MLHLLQLQHVVGRHPRREREPIHKLQSRCRCQKGIPPRQEDRTVSLPRQLPCHHQLLQIVLRAVKFALLLSTYLQALCLQCLMQDLPRRARCLERDCLLVATRTLSQQSLWPQKLHKGDSPSHVASSTPWLHLCQTPRTMNLTFLKRTRTTPNEARPKPRDTNGQALLVNCSASGVRSLAARTSQRRSRRQRRSLIVRVPQ